MREIKFRAWDKDYKKMITNFLLPESKSFGMHRMAISFTGEVFTFTDWNMAEYDEDEMYNSAKYPSRFKIMQYTGLKDKNGREIYEGDIVKYKFAFYRDISKVEFNQDIAAFDMVSIKELDDNSSMRAFKKGSRRGFNKNLVAGFDYVEVVGNIYENPELLVKT